MYAFVDVFSVKHMNALARTVVGNPLAEPRRGGGVVLTALDRRHVENLDSLLREGPRREQCA
jgi:hypothetical protein